MGTETKVFDKVVVTTVNVNIYGGLEYYGSGVKIYPFKGNFDNFENFKKFIYKDRDIFTSWDISEEESDLKFKTMYEKFIEGESSSVYFELFEETGLSGKEITIFAIPNEPIADGSYINVANIKLFNMEGKENGEYE